MPQPRCRSVPCKIDGCSARARQRGRCKKHYRLWRLENPEPSLLKEPEYHKAVHASPYWYLWKVRKDKGQLGPEWLSTDRFAQDIHPRPKDHSLQRIDDSLPFGPDNFYWKPKIIQQEGEPIGDMRLRQRLDLLTRVPDFERMRMLKRRYNMTMEEFDVRLAKQRFGCAICKRPETSLGRSRKVKCLAVDHCHSTGKIRGLLCYDCNVTLGRMGESIERLEAMIGYIRKHSEPELQVVLLA